MSRKVLALSSLLVFLAFVCVAFFPQSARARNSYQNAFIGMYNPCAKLQVCETCHGDKSIRNPYGQDVEEKLNAGFPIDQALSGIEGFDSDGDGFDNLTEITSCAFPGDPGDYPAVTPECPDNDGDGFAVCEGGCDVPAGKDCGDCDDNDPSIYPGATEICDDGKDNDCNGLVDGDDPYCGQPGASDYDIVGFRCSHRAEVGGKSVSVKVVVKNLGSTDPGALLTVYDGGMDPLDGTPLTVFEDAGNGRKTYAFSYSPVGADVGEITFTAVLEDEDPDEDTATCTTIIVRRKSGGSASYGPLADEVSTSGSGWGVAIPNALVLVGNYPNPFTHSTEVRFGLPFQTDVTIEVYGVQGKRVFVEYLHGLSAGWNSYFFAARDGEGKLLPAGVYFIRLSAAGTTRAKKMLLIR